MTSVTRSDEATNPPAVRHVTALRGAAPNGSWGMWLLIATEATLLSALVASYWYLRFRTTSWPPPGIPDPKVALPLALTGGLLLTSIPMELAARSAGAGRLGRARLLLIVALLMGAAYLGVQINEVRLDLNDFRPETGAYASAYYAVTVAHHAHVLIGLLLVLGLLIRLVAGLTTYRAVGVRAVAWYWHFVNLMAIVVVLTIVSPSL
jgi:cytochrome c oxidase subunit 3